MRPADIDELRSFLQHAHAHDQKVSSVDLSSLNLLLEHKAEDMTATVQAGMTVAHLQQALAKRGQWLPVDPPQPAQLTVGDLLATNASGPRRFGYGTVRDYLIGIQVALADGRLIRSGGKVVKNVAGYDLMKLFIGSRGSLGVIVEATFKVLPLVESEQFVTAACASLDEADKLLDAILDSELNPVVLDLHNSTHDASSLSLPNSSPPTRHSSLVLGFAGTPESVQWQLTKAAEFGFKQPASLQYQAEFFRNGAPFSKASVLPSRTIQAVRSLGTSPFVARAGNGIIYHRGSLTMPPQNLAAKLQDRVKNEFDPRHIFPVLTQAV